MQAAHLLQPTPPQLWDIFCRVVDNYGDAGVCWRLCADLAARGHRLRLWIDDSRPLDWMAPGATQGQCAGITVHPWADACNAELVQSLPMADVWIEAFGCDIAPEFIAASAGLISAGGTSGQNPPVWINLEYLSAEDWVPRHHGLPSPVMHGPAAGWTKYFYFPGFTPATGGLLREPWVTDTQALSPADKRQWLADLGIPWQGERIFSLFCYEPVGLPQLLNQLAQAPESTLMLVTAGRASHAVQQAAGDRNTLGKLSIAYLPHLTQAAFDQLLQVSDFNAVRGEDSLVRALWAGRPFVWHIYPQDDGAHVPKLTALLNALGSQGAGEPVHDFWNGIAPAPPPDWPWRGPWAQCVQRAREALLRQPDLCTQLIEFVAKKR